MISRLLAFLFRDPGLPTCEGCGKTFGPHEPPATNTPLICRDCWSGGAVSE